MSRDWTFSLEDIQESCARVLRYTTGTTFEQFKQDDKPMMRHTLETIKSECPTVAAVVPNDQIAGPMTLAGLTARYAYQL